MRIEYWTRLSWWQRSRLAMVGTVAAGTVIALVIAGFIAALASSAVLQSLSWLAFTGFPLLVVVLTASLARLQERINVRSPQSRDEGPDRSGQKSP
ncbi:MAG: hypothetical protein ABJM29_02920 [Rhizobiaceae bacterium]